MYCFFLSFYHIFTHLIHQKKKDLLVPNTALESCQNEWGQGPGQRLGRASTPFLCVYFFFLPGRNSCKNLAAAERTSPMCTDVPTASPCYVEALCFRARAGGGARQTDTTLLHRQDVCFPLEFCVGAARWRCGKPVMLIFFFHSVPVWLVLQARTVFKNTISFKKIIIVTLKISP